MASQGFVKASSNNLPCVHIFMVTEFIKNDERFNATEFKGVKAAAASREKYGDSAIGYVELKREGPLCTVKARICPEHRVRSKAYSVYLIVDEVEERIVNVYCQDCAASSGGCKHSLAFLMWVHRRSEDPAPTEVFSYWVKPNLSNVGTSKKFIKAEDFAPQFSASKMSIPLDNSSFMQDVVQIAKENYLEGQILKYNCDDDDMQQNKFSNLSIYNLFLQFTSNSGINFNDFLLFVQDKVTANLCKEAEKLTRQQSTSPLWHEMRFARITASKLHEMAKCQTSDGTLVESIIGAYKIKDNKHMMRGRNLEKKVIKIVEDKLNIKVKDCGLFVLPTYPIFGASPDGISVDYVIEVKCPSSEKTVKNYIKQDQITEKFKAQVQLQMFCAKKQKGLFCVADPQFEKNNNVKILVVDFDDNYTKRLISESLENWKNFVFVKLMEAIRD